MEFYKNLDLLDIIYFCEIDKVEKTEQWLPVIEYEGVYEVSDLGRIKSIERYVLKIDTPKLIKSRILKQFLGKRGYLSVNFSLLGITKTNMVHKLVSMSFHKHKPCGYEIVINHKNFIRTDNRKLNLEETTQRENANMKHLKSTSKYTGVHYDKKQKKWISIIVINGKNKFLGSFKDELEASTYYENALISIKNGLEIKTKKRICSSIYKGVTWCKLTNKWRAQIVFNKNRTHLGLFHTEEEASIAYKKEFNKLTNK